MKKKCSNFFNSMCTSGNKGEWKSIHSWWVEIFFKYQWMMTFFLWEYFPFCKQSSTIYEKLLFNRTKIENGHICVLHSILNNKLSLAICQKFLYGIYLMMRILWQSLSIHPFVIVSIAKEWFLTRIPTNLTTFWKCSFFFLLIPIHLVLVTFFSLWKVL